MKTKKYIPQFPGGGKLSYSKGKIKKIHIFDFSHLASTKGGSSGSSIFIKGTIKVIGIYKAGKKDKTENYGDFIGPIIESLKNNFEYDEKYYDGEGVYEGEYKNNIRQGFGKFTTENGEYFIGEWINGEMNGKGTLYSKNGNIIFEGNFIEGKPE